MLVALWSCAGRLKVQRAIQRVSASGADMGKSR